MPEAGPRYWAFLSYSHADIRWAQRLHRALEGYLVPTRLVGRPTPSGSAPRRLRPIFRDLDEMGAGADLSDRLKRALSESGALIVVCSPAAVASRWLNEEVRRFKAERGEARIFSVIVGGEPFASERPGDEAAECFPEALRHRHADGERIEPIAADLRPGRDSLRAAVLKLVAGVLDVELDELVQRDAARRNRQLVALTSVFGATAAVMAALAATAFAERDAARRERGQAESLVEFMIGDLKDKLQPAGRLDILDAIGVRAQAYYAAEGSHGLDAASLERRAKVLHMLGESKFERGDLPTAMALFRQAAESTGELLRRRPNDPQVIFTHAQSMFYIGEVALRRRDIAEALRQFRAYQALAHRLVAIDPQKPDWQAEVGYADEDVGVALLKEPGHADEALADFQDAYRISSRLAMASPGKRNRQWGEAQDLAWLADAELQRGGLQAALAHRAAEARIYEGLIAASPHDTEAEVELAASRAQIAEIELKLGSISQALGVLQAAAADTDRLMREAPDNDFYKSALAPVLQALAQAQLEHGRLADAAETAQRAVALAEGQVRLADERHEDAVVWHGVNLGGARIVAIRIAAAGSRSVTSQAQALSPALAESRRLRSLVERFPQDDKLPQTAAEAALLAGDGESLAGDTEGARGDWQWAARMLAAAAPTASAIDRTAILLRQADYRLSLMRPPAGRSGGPGSVHPASRGRSPLTDYRW